MHTPYGDHQTARCSSPSTNVRPCCMCGGHAACWPWRTSTPSEWEDLYPAASTRTGKTLVTHKTQSRCRSRVPCAVGSISWAFTSLPAVASSCCLDFIAREQSIVKGLDMPQHSAPRLHCNLLLFQFDAWDILPLFPHVQAIT